MANKYDKDTDYQDLINKAVQSGDYYSAAKYEKQRNAKIADLDAAGTNTYGAKATNNYSQYLMTKPDDFVGSALKVNTYTNQQEDIQSLMNENSELWWDAYDAGNKDWMAQLEAANRELAAKLGGNVVFDSASGKWSGSADQPVAQKLSSFNLSDMGSRPTFDMGDFVGSKPVYESDYSDRIDALLNQILNREKFSYDANADPMFQQYKETYNREGTRAMNDALATVAGSAGGMNSYAMTAAQQANDYYNAQLNDKIPELYKLAYSMYMDDLDNQRADLSTLQGVDNTQYNRYRDQVGDWYNDRDFAYGMHRDQVGDWENDRDFAYGMHRDDVSDHKWETEFNYGVERDKIADQRYDQEWQYGVERDKLEDQRYEDELAYDRAMDKLKASNTSTSNSKTGNSGNDVLNTIYGMDSEAEVYAYLVAKNYSQSEVENLMGYWEQNRTAEEEPAVEEIDNTEGLQWLRQLEKEGASMAELRQQLLELYQNGLITEEAYNRRQDRYR